MRQVLVLFLFCSWGNRLRDSGNVIYSITKCESQGSNLAKWAVVGCRLSNTPLHLLYRCSAHSSIPTTMPLRKPRSQQEASIHSSWSAPTSPSKPNVILTLPWRHLESCNPQLTLLPQNSQHSFSAPVLWAPSICQMVKSLDYCSVLSFNSINVEWIDKILQCSTEISQNYTFWLLVYNYLNALLCIVFAVQTDLSSDELV